MHLGLIEAASSRVRVSERACRLATHQDATCKYHRFKAAFEPGRTHDRILAISWLHVRLPRTLDTVHVNVWMQLSRCTSRLPAAFNVLKTPVDFNVVSCRVIRV